MAGACHRPDLVPSFSRRLFPASKCDRVGLGLWLAVAILGLTLAWLTGSIAPAGDSTRQPPPPVAAGASQ